VCNTVLYGNVYQIPCPRKLTVTITSDSLYFTLCGYHLNILLVLLFDHTAVMLHLVIQSLITATCIP
jgi:hypothetical protein